MRDDHRVYSYLSEPVRIFGLTIDEIVIGLGGFSFFSKFEGPLLYTFAGITVEKGIAQTCRKDSVLKL